MKKSIFFFLLIFQAVGHSQSFQEKLIKWTADSDLKNASIGFKAIQLNTGKVIAAYNSQQALIPASNLKLLTTAAAIETFEPNKKLETKLLYSGKIENGILKGDLIIKGGGDPTLGSKYNKNDVFLQWVKDIKELGIKSIEGRIVSDASSFPDYDIPRTWIWEDIGNYYGSGVSALSFIDNSFKISFSSPNQAQKATEVIKITPEIPNLKIENKVLSSNSKSDNAYIFGGPYNFNKKAEGTIPKSRKSFSIKGSLPDPALQVAFMFRNKLISSGISVKEGYSTIRNLKLEGKELPDSNILLSTYSGLEMHIIVYYINRNSVNLYAEHLHRLLGLEKLGMANVNSGNESIMDFLENKNLPVSGVNLMDGSGMSRFNTVTTDLMTALLIEMKKSKRSQYFINSLAVSGESGTFKNFLNYPSTKGKVIGKSGYMERVRSYSGYINTDDSTVAFSIIVNNYSCSASFMKKKIELLLLELSKE